MTAPNLPPETQADLAKLFFDLSHDPKTRKKIGKLVKEFKPDSPHAAAFADVDLHEEMDKFRKEQEDRELDRQKQDMLRQMNAKRSALLVGGPDGQGPKYSEDDVKKIEALMQQKGISDYDDGRTLYAATLPPVDPSPQTMPAAHGATWEFPEVERFGANPDKAARDTAHAMIGDFMRKR
jgi:hypothetical protein